MAVKKRGNVNVCEVFSSTLLKNSRMGNPRMRIVFAVVDGEWAERLRPVIIGTTACDYSFVYGLPTEFEGKFEVEWHRTPSGRVVITDMREHKGA